MTLSKYKIKKEYEGGKNIAFISPSLGQMPLDSEILTDKIVETAIREGCPYFEELRPSAVVELSANTEEVEPKAPKK